MSLSEKVQQLNRDIGSAMERALDEVRLEVSQWLRTSSDDLVGRLATLHPEIPDSFVDHEDLAPAVSQAAEELSSQASHGSAAEMRDSLSAIDRARTQADILGALLHEAGRHASRAAILLLRGEEVRGWSGAGFGDAGAGIRDLSLGAPQAGPWSYAFQGRGPAHLGSADCALLCSRLEVAVPREGALVPMVLRDRVAAVLYADRSDGEPLAIDALQLLGYVSALAIESLPFRERVATATLEPAQGEPVHVPTVTAEVPRADLLKGVVPPAAEAPAAPAREKAEEKAGEKSLFLETEPEALPETQAIALPSVEEEEVDTVRAAAPSPEDAWDSVSAPEMEAPALDLPPELEPWAAAGTVEAVTETAPTVPAMPAIPGVPEADESTTPTQKVDLQGLNAAVAERDRAEAAALSPLSPVASPEATIHLERSALQEALAPPPVAPPPAPVTAQEVQEERPAPAPPPLRPVAAPPPAPVSSPPGADDTSPSLAGTPEVRPPSDLQGPGWAFASARTPVSPNEEALHEEARRLARLLVSEIKLYNEEQVEEGRRRRDVYERLREDIDRSRQMYEERVEPRILKTTDYFYQELVRILAAGDAKALGI